MGGGEVLFSVTIGLKYTTSVSVFFFCKGSIDFHKNVKTRLIGFSGFWVTTRLVWSGIGWTGTRMDRDSTVLSIAIIVCRALGRKLPGPATAPIPLSRFNSSCASKTAVDGFPVEIRCSAARRRDKSANVRSGCAATLYYTNAHSYMLIAVR